MFYLGRVIIYFLFVFLFEGDPNFFWGEVPKKEKKGGGGGLLILTNYVDLQQFTTISGN